MSAATLTSRQEEALHFLAAGPLTVKELAAMIGTKPDPMRSTLLSLNAKGLVRRDRSDDEIRWVRT